MKGIEPCSGCQHEIMCAWKEEYKELNTEFNRFFENVDSNKFRGYLYCFYNNSQD